MEVYENGASVDPMMRMIDEGCTIQLTTRDNQNFLNPDTQPMTRMHVEFDNLSYSVSCKKEKSKKLLESVTGCFRPGKLTAIIGPSGAGKTTLLRIVSTLKTTNVKGSITVNGREWNGGVFRKQTCFLPQEFALLPLLTTRETLYIAARLKVQGVRGSRSFCLIVNEIAENLGLTHCLNTLVENLSGGERKRLSIGIEMVTRPCVLLLDEPTSGLDSTSSNQVIGLLHNMARTGCTVACAIHQPSSRTISQFDDLLVLHKGKSFYCGNWDDVLPTFESAGYACPPFYNIAEFVLEVVTAERGGDLCNLYTNSREKYSEWKTHFKYPNMGSDSAVTTKIDNTSSKSKSISMWQEQKILLTRAMICIRRDNTLTKLRFAAHVVVAFLLGVVFYNSGTDASRVNSNIACVFFILLFLYFASSMPAVLTFPIEAAVFLREYLNNWYRLRSYYTAKIMSDLPLQILSPSIFIVIAYCMTGQPIECVRFVRTWLICILTTVVGQSSGMLVGVAFDTHLGVFLIPALNMPMILFAGFFLKFSEVTFYLQPLCVVSFFRYAFEGILVTIYGDGRERLPCSKLYCHLRSPNRILEEMNMPTITYYTAILGLLVWIICLQALTYLVLKWKAYMAKR
ncbi:ATP-binding cassette sub-family G member 1-like isoform X1 [Hylaeus anthracinus]|uniref:ATP-binding cassette sub-family G member 1-like isoform X1 n=1 Tax=Hylaeus anthracinus TaxID=313031 RepID=UPI0023B8FA92|nr:ATP-binding cassette sub-family G member 1-like isoform X1 [Hylaeus anthracinus]XP_054012493.1 ATP-binding cassette sub-family G member 1-like isoform X1 [Hylaeus anthracinus]XP_054012494.1 ATP-binding cassette sub-family G member 1-like isoform X1 [Hylaeus anthracinus]XP_054012495.1 ATP-binding cassette sub-family G member 1-like isoform X1 [Hylaeus anthracinus]XP_054012496.1 ATP-binding cassette sub-family G member 1-like isoform X1 [Hylaeus anthracinus]